MGTIRTCLLPFKPFWILNSKFKISCSAFEIWKVSDTAYRLAYSRKIAFIDYMYEVCSKSVANFVFFSKIIYFFMNIYFVPFKVIPTLVSTVFPIFEALQKMIFCDIVQLLLRCRLYLLNRRVASSFHGALLFREQEKVTGGQIWGIWWIRHW